MKIQATQIFRKIRKLIPVSMYPLLAPVYRRERRRKIREIEKLDAEYLKNQPDTLVPSADLRARVVGPCTIEAFLSGDIDTATNIEQAIGQLGLSISDFRRGLDFGCGCGRLLLQAEKKWAHMQWTGSDVDQLGVNWCVDHLKSARCHVNQATPPLEFEDQSFDVIWCGSVFTHLDEEYQNQWLRELARLLTRDGVFIASVHGPNCWKVLPEATIRKIEERGFLYYRTGGDEDIHPDWYQTAFHTQAYIRSRWGHYFRVEKYIPKGFNNYQDVVVCRALNQA